MSGLTSQQDELVLLRKRARRRLIGAIVMSLVASGVMLRVLDSKPQHEMRPEPWTSSATCPATASPPPNRRCPPVKPAQRQRRMPRRPARKPPAPRRLRRHLPTLLRRPAPRLRPRAVLPPAPRPLLPTRRQPPRLPPRWRLPCLRRRRPNRWLPSARHRQSRIRHRRHPSRCHAQSQPSLSR